MTAAGVQLAAGRGQAAQEKPKAHLHTVSGGNLLNGHGGDLEETWSTHGGSRGAKEESRGFVLVEFGKDEKPQHHPAH
jgi:hypothetical protein